MGSRRSESWGRHERMRGYESGGWESRDGRHERRRERERRYDDRRGSSAEDFGRRSEGVRQVKCYECGEFGHYKSHCPRSQGRYGGGGGALTVSRELEESLSYVGRMAKQLLEQQKEAEEAKREAEKKLKKEEEEKAAKEEEVRIAMAKKQAKEDKEKRRRWELKKLLAEQREEHKEKFEKIVGLSRKLKGVSIETKKKDKVKEMPSSSSEQDDEDVEEATPLKDKRKRRDSTGAVENSPPVETPKKLGKKKEVETPVSQKRKGRGRPTKADSQAAQLARGVDPWEGVPIGEKYATEVGYRKAVRKTIASSYPETLKEMCKGASLPFYGVNDAVDTLLELRVTYCFGDKKSQGSTSSKQGEEDQIKGEIQDPQEDPDE
ncbi:hypothetical protein CBR_g48223 [Chara braunii]|uniref:CCHC-type domain-containing protein n=1 Tax=Chara braunii TaxID=69332 RepID=A0A388M2A5_CHABU|nr:hypothetical protein CBR_g48223 [Chara braunii]|eukprot:GBG88694.1 hypothetical protein CBR_g48223 [Chara braunii]